MIHFMRCEHTWRGAPVRGRSSRQHVQTNFRSRRTLAPSAQGRWTLVDAADSEPMSPTIRSHAVALQLLKRHGVVTRETMGLENIVGGFSAVYDVLKALEESGRVRRGYFVAGLGGVTVRAAFRD